EKGEAECSHRLEVNRQIARQSRVTVAAHCHFAKERFVDLHSGERSGQERTKRVSRFTSVAPTTANSCADPPSMACCMHAHAVHMFARLPTLTHDKCSLRLCLPS